jgi:hypothetical protein
VLVLVLREESITCSCWCWCCALRVHGASQGRVRVRVGQVCHDRDFVRRVTTMTSQMPGLARVYREILSTEQVVTAP